MDIFQISALSKKVIFFWGFYILIPWGFALWSSRKQMTHLATGGRGTGQLLLLGKMG